MCWNRLRVKWVMFGEHPGQACSPRAPVDSCLEKWPALASLPAAPAAGGLSRTAQTRVFLQKGAVDPARFRLEARSGAQGFHTSPTGPGPCPVPEGGCGHLRAPPGAGPCVLTAPAASSRDCPSSRVTGCCSSVLSSTQIPGQRPPAVRSGYAGQLVGAEPALSHGDLGCRRTVQPWPAAWGPSPQGRLLTCVTSDPR